MDTEAKTVFARTQELAQDLFAFAQDYNRTACLVDVYRNALLEIDAIANAEGQVVTDDLAVRLRKIIHAVNEADVQAKRIMSTRKESAK